MEVSGVARNFFKIIPLCIIFFYNRKLTHFLYVIDAFVFTAPIFLNSTERRREIPIDRTDFKSI